MAHNFENLINLLVSKCMVKVFGEKSIYDFLDKSFKLFNLELHHYVSLCRVK